MAVKIERFGFSVCVCVTADHPQMGAGSDSCQGVHFLSILPL